MDDGRPAVQKWIAHVAPEQRPLARRLDRLILTVLPKAVSGVKYRKPSQPLGVPFYGMPDQGWIVNQNALKGRIRLTFLVKAALKPLPPIRAPGGVRAIDIATEDDLDETQVKAWLRQAKKLDGWGHVD